MKKHGARDARQNMWRGEVAMNTKIISKGMDLPKNDLDEFYEFLDEGECVPMSIPILKKRV